VAAVELLREVGRVRGRLLEVGCGPGWGLEVFRDAGFEASGAECSPHAVGSARERGLRVLELDLESATVADLVEVSGERPVVIAALELLEHVTFPLEALRKLSEVLEPGGHWIVSLPNEIHVGARIAIAAGRLPFGGHADPHLRHFDRRRARELLRAAGLRIVGSRPQSVVPSRHGVVRAAVAPLVRLLPGLFSLSEVYLLEGDRVRGD
jgi:2-polyprenyl-3-methyl-5-hydroxy-6-metoxy-1,4-benzoquinol methylase